MDKKFFLFLLFLSAVGLTTGCYFEIFLNGTGKDHLMQQLSSYFSAQNVEADPVLSSLQTAARGLCFLLPAFLMPLFPFLLPVNLAMLFFRSMFLGFTSAMLLEVFGLQGVLYNAVTLASSELLTLFLFFFLLSCSAEKYHVLRNRRKNTKKALRLLAGQYLYTYAAGLGLLLLICLFRASVLHTLTGS